MSISNLSNPLTLDEFIQPLDEQVDDDNPSSNDIMATLIENYSQEPENTGDGEGSKEGVEEEVKLVGYSEALRALKCLKL
jgi:hypothetical protein